MVIKAEEISVLDTSTWYMGFIPQIRGLPPIVMWFITVLIILHSLAFITYVYLLLKNLKPDPSKDYRELMERNKQKTE